MQSDAGRSNQGPAARFAEVLDQLGARGVKQRDVALELNVPPQYISDLRHGRRSLTEQFARRVAEVYRVRAAWLLAGEGIRDLPDTGFAVSQTTGVCLLPVLSSPDRGDPRHSHYWDGSMVPLAGAAAAAAQRAQIPFVLRIGADDPAGRLRKNDLVLCSQEPPDDAAVVIVRMKDEVRLARADGKGRYRALATGRPISEAEPIGYCIGIVWAPL